MTLIKVAWPPRAILAELVRLFGLHAKQHTSTLTSEQLCAFLRDYFKIVEKVPKSPDMTPTSILLPSLT